jgi:hypothetical protein
VAEDGYAGGEDKREKAGPGSSLDEDAVAGKQYGILGELDVDSIVTVLDIEIFEIARVVGDGCFECDG